MSKSNAKRISASPTTLSRRGFVALGAAALAGVASGCAQDAGEASETGGPAGQPSDSSGGEQAPQGATENPGASPAAETPAEQPIPGTGITKTELDARVDAVLASLTPEQKAGQLFIVRPESILNGNADLPDDYLDGVAMPDETFASAYAEVQPGGVCLFDKNIVSPDQVRLMTSAIDSMSRSSAGLPAFLAVDEEGGSVSRIANNPAFGVANVGPMGDVGAAGDPQAARGAASAIAAYLGSLGFNLDLAPVCDIVNNPASPTMVGRSFGADADLVCSMVDAFVGGMADAGMMCSAKHFPGIGGAAGDSHFDSIRTDKTVDQLAAEEFRPFSAAIARGVPFVMLGHIVCDVATGSDLPATVNPTVVGDWLRARLGFGGVAITDSMEMESVAGRYGWGDAAVAALQAGVDVVLLPVNLRVALGAVLAAVADGRLAQARVDEAVRRVVRQKVLWDSRV